MRKSKNEFDEKGNLINGFDYNLQVWVVNGIIQFCGHPAEMQPNCCNAGRLFGKKLSDVKKDNA